MTPFFERTPFFFDQNRFNSMRNGTLAPEGFSSAAEAQDYFAQSNVLAVVVEVPNDLLGTAPAHAGTSYGLENLPKNQPVLILGNHRNALLDALLVACYTNRLSHYLTRAGVFKKNVVSKFLKSLQK